MPGWCRFRALLPILSLALGWVVVTGWIPAVFAAKPQTPTLQLRWDSDFPPQHPRTDFPRRAQPFDTPLEANE